MMNRNVSTSTPSSIIRATPAMSSSRAAFSGRDISNTGITSGYPDRICDGNVSGRKDYANPAGNLACFAVPAAGIGRFGNSGRGIIEAAPNRLWNMSLYKDISIYERVKFRFGFQALNVFNWFSWGYYNNNSNIGSPTALQAGGSVKGDSRARVLHLHLKLWF